MSDKRTSPSYLNEIAELIATDYADSDRSVEMLMTSAGQLLNLISHCSSEIDPIRDDFNKAIDRYRNFEVRTLDEAFGCEDARKGTKLAAHHFALTEGYDVYCRIEQMLVETDLKTAAGRELESVFSVVAEEYERSEGAIRSLYYDVKKAIERHQ